MARWSRARFWNGWDWPAAQALARAQPERMVELETAPEIWRPYRNGKTFQSVVLLYISRLAEAEGFA